MKLIKKYNQHRRDCDCDLECEKCGSKETLTGAYDDRNYWGNVVPDMKCGECGESTVSLNLEVAPISTRYSQHEVI